MDGVAKKRKKDDRGLRGPVRRYLFIFMVLDLAQAFIPLSFEEAFWALFGIGSETRHDNRAEDEPAPGHHGHTGRRWAGHRWRGHASGLPKPHGLPVHPGAIVRGFPGGGHRSDLHRLLASAVLMIPLLAFVTCMATLFLVYSISQVGGRVPTETLAPGRYRRGITALRPGLPPDLRGRGADAGHRLLDHGQPDQCQLGQHHDRGPADHCWVHHHGLLLPRPQRHDAGRRPRVRTWAWRSRRSDCSC